MVIRSYVREDWDAVWSILEPVFRAGETYAVPADISETAAKVAWTGGGKTVFVASEAATGELLGTYYLRGNFDGPASHVCNCGYAVAEGARGRGVASRMCEHSQTEAVVRGYRAMQYNCVVSTNDHAIRLWKRMGFHIVGTLSGAFLHPRLGYVDAYVMYKQLGDGAAGAAGVHRR